jgi:hypothetical protein
MAVLSIFNQTQAQTAKYWYERLLYTYGPETIPSGVNPVFNIPKINKTAVPSWMAVLARLAVTQNANVALGFGFDGQSIPATAVQGFSDAAIAGVRDDRLFIPAAKSMSMQTLNSGAPVASFQLNFQTEMRKLSIADKILRGIQLTPNELAITQNIDVASLVAKGTAPIPWEAQLERTYSNRILYEDVRLLHVDASTIDASFLTIQTKNADEFLVLRELAIEGGAATTVSVDRDADPNYMGVSGSAFVQADDAPWDVFVPALNYLTFHVQSTANLVNVPIRVRVWHCKLSNLLRVRFGLVSKGEVPGGVYEKALAGVA